VKIVVLTTSYPRFDGDAAGRFVADAVEHVRARGHEVDVVAPGRSFPGFGLAYGAGVVGNLKARPWMALLVPAFLLLFVRTARRAARDADVVHAHWLQSGAVALATGRPTVVQLWGTDVELARRARPLARWILRRARLVVCASNALAAAARELGARDVRVVPTGVDVPPDDNLSQGTPDEPPAVLFVGRLSREKGILELVQAIDGLDARLVVAGDGPLRAQVPGAHGFVPHHALGELYDRAAVVAVPSLREGFGVACAEAMAHGKPVVASAVGGLLDLVVDGRTGLRVPPGDVEALHDALARLLADPELRARLGMAGRERVRERFSWAAATDATLVAYADAARR
jgi:glycosyltransferase involved in cell wall biosynthesis